MTRQNKTASINHEPSLATQLLLVSALVIFGVCFYLFIRATYRDGALPVSTGYITRSETVFKNYNVVYPVFHSEKVDQLMRNYVIHQVEDFQRVNGKSYKSGNELVINYTVIHHDTHTLSVRFNKSEHLAGKLEVRSQHVVTYDLVRQTQLQLADIFNDKPVARTLFARILHDYFQQRDSNTLTPSELEQFSKITPEDIQEFALNDGMLIIYADPHQPAAAQDKVAIGIKKDVLAAVLGDTFVSVSPGITPDVDVSLTYSIEAMPYHDISTDPNARMLALTFDDGPGNQTPELLDVLKKYGAHATFFVIGRQVSTYADTVRREVNEGNEIGNHSWSHPNLTLLSQAGLRQQIGDTQQVIKEVTGGYTPVLMRPPQGVFNGPVAAYIGSQGMNVQLWNVDTLDWLNRDAQVVYDRVMSAAADGRVILLHDIHPTSIAAATRAIPELVARGYQLVTVSELNKYRK